MKTFNNIYYLGVSDVRKEGDIAQIANFVKPYINDSFLRIGIGINTDNVLLRDIKEENRIKALIKKTKNYYPPLVAIVHYTFKN